MTANQLSRVLLVALGAYIIVDGLATILDLISPRPLVYTRDDIELPSILTSAALSLGLGFVSALLFSFLPGAYVLSKAAHWSDRWFPPEPMSNGGSASPSTYYSVGIAVLSAYFIVVGVASFVAGIARLVYLYWVGDDFGFDLSLAWGHFSSGGAFLIAGLWLNRFARRAIQNP